MAENNDEILNVIGDMSFLPEEAKDENLGRSFPKLRTNEKYVRLGWCGLLLAGVITYLVFLFIYGTKGYYFSSSPNGNYGLLGVIVTALMVIAFCASHAYGYLYDTKLSLLDDKKKVGFYHSIQTSLYYLAFLLFYVAIFTTVLRPYVFQTMFSADGAFVQSLGTITLVIMTILSICGIILSFVKPNISKIYNCVILALGLWVVVFFSSIFSHAHSYSVSSNYAIMLFIFGAVFADLALPFYLLQKKTGFRSVFHMLLSVSLVFDSLAILVYGMATLG
jgi:hypothetical protein